MGGIMKNIFPLILNLVILIACSSTRQNNEDYFGYSNFPQRKEEKNLKLKTKTLPEYPIVTSNQPFTTHKNQFDANTVIINNYYGPLHPKYYSYDPFDIIFSFSYGDPFDPFYSFYPVIYMPYHYPYRTHFIYYPYDPFYWNYLYPRRGVIYIPYEKEKERARTVRDFGPSRDNYDKDNSSVPTRQARSSSRDNKKTTSMPNVETKNNPSLDTAPKDVIKRKSSEKISEPKEDNSQRSKTKQERSSTRPK